MTNLGTNSCLPTRSALAYFSSTSASGPALEVRWGVQGPCRGKDPGIAAAESAFSPVCLWSQHPAKGLGTEGVLRDRVGGGLSGSLMDCVGAACHLSGCNFHPRPLITSLVGEPASPPLPLS